VIVQVELAGTYPPDKLIAADPEPVPLSAPAQLLVTVEGLATTRLLGKLSVNAAPVSGMPLGLVMTRLSVEVPPIRIDAGLNDLVIVGVPMTCSVAVLLGPYVPEAVVRLPVVLRYLPPLAAVTATVMLQVDRMETDALLKDIEFEPAVAPVTVPRQVLLIAGVPATTRPAGNASVKETELWPNDNTLVIFSVRVDVPPALMVVGEKVFVT
jgi:hypothetical protein